MKTSIITLVLFCISTFTWAQLPDSLQQRHNAQAFSELQFGLFVHFGVNTYTTQEWTDGTVSPAVFNPTELDTDQWCEAAVSAGMKYIVLTAKHHDGFCLWNTQYTDYSIKSSPLKKDIVAQLSQSCKKYGLQLGLYYSLWDRHEKSYNNSYLYTEYMKNQLNELLSYYGSIQLIWFDGVWDKCTGFGYDGVKVKGKEVMSAWRNDGAFRWQWDQIYAFIKNKNPNCLVMNNSGTDFPGIPLMPVDIRSGERANKKTSSQTDWRFANTTFYLPLQIEETAAKKNWFFHKGDHSVKSVAEIKALLKDAASIKANLLLNVGPMENGKLRPEDIELLKSLSIKN